MPTNPTEDLQVTTRSQWKGVQKEGVLTPLPSGNVVRVRRSMDLLDLMKAGKIPNPLAGLVQGMIDKRKVEITNEDLDPDTLMEAMRFIDDAVVKAVTEPKLIVPPQPELDEDATAYSKRLDQWKLDIDDPASDDYDPEGVPLTWLDMDDRMFVFVFAQGFAADLESFREETATALARVPDGPPVPKPTKRTTPRKRR